MRDLSKLVDRILKIEPDLEALLLPIKEKWDKGPKRSSYWKQLLKILNAEITPIHPHRNDIQSLFSYKSRKVPRKLYTFEEPTPAETILGTIPEFMESHFRKYDRLQIEYAKLALEAKMTHNEELMVDVNKKCEKLDINQKKVWYELKNYFNIWKVGVPTSFFIRSKGTLLVLTAIRLLQPQQSIPPGGDNFPEAYMLRLDNETLKKILRYLNISPPPGFSPPPESE